MESLYGKTPEEIGNILRLEKPYQGKIIASFLDKGILSFSDMTSLSKELRERLKKEFGSPSSSKVVKISKDDSAIKILIRLSDESYVEAVRLSDGKDRYTACLSSEVGCKMGCIFCRTGDMGFKRNLTSGEIIEEFLHLRALGAPISNIVYMGMGEPLLNIRNVIDSISYFHDEAHMDMSLRRITISTSGVVPGIDTLRSLKLPVRLAISLNSADQRIRERLMPVTKHWGLRDLKRSLMSYQRTMGKRITLEYVMISGWNMEERDAYDLARFSEGLEVMINLIPLNEGAESHLKTPSEMEIASFLKSLNRYEIPYTIRRSKGKRNNAACGLLAATEDDR